MMILSNPELKKNIWLDFSLHRVLLTTLIIVLLVYMFSLFGQAPSAEFCAFYTSCFFIFIWGCKNASETVLEEVNNNTWDFQRQSVIAPWNMTWGKLLGSTLFSWYGAFVAFALYLFPFGTPHPIDTLGLADKLIRIEIICLGGLLGQAVALLMSLQILPQVRQEKSNPTFKYFLTGAFVGIFFTELTLASHYEINLSGKFSTITWYHQAFKRDSFLLISLIIFLIWTLIGLKRSFSKELQYGQIPWVWFAFNVYMLIYFAGLAVNDFNLPTPIQGDTINNIQTQIQNLPYLTAFFVAQTLTYIALFFESISILNYKKMLTRLHENTREALQQLPWWVISAVLVFLMMVVNMVQSSQPITENVSIPVFIFTSTLFLCRDIVLVHFFNFSKSPRKALSTSVIYLALLYLLIPLILRGVQLHHLLPAFLPSWGQNTTLGVISPLVQIAILFWGVRRKWENQDI